MLDTLGEYWWILFLLAYCVILVVLIRSGIWARHGPRILLAISCAIILTIPFMDRPYGVVAAVFIVLSLVISSMNSFKETPSKSEDR